MKTLDLVANEIYQTLKNNGPLWSLREEWCSQTFQQAHAIRAMLAAYRVKKQKGFLEQGKAWAEMTIRLQGTHGHPDAYNKGTGIRTKNGVPDAWFVADCGTVAVALLDVASLLNRKSALYKKILESVSRFADYIIKTWTLPDGSFSLGIMDFKTLDKKPYHCANAQSNLFLWPLYEMTGNKAYLDQALKTTKWLAYWTDYDCGYAGGAIHNRSYNGESLMVSLTNLGKGHKGLKQQIVKNLEQNIIKWALDNFGGVWIKDSNLSNPKDPLLLMVLQLYSANCKKSKTLSNTIKKGYSILDKKIEESWKIVKKHNMSGAAIASYIQPVGLGYVSKPKYYTSDGITGMALVTHEDHCALFPLR